MSMNMFANHKMALGFGGLTVAVAMIAALSVDAFLPAGNEPAPQNVETAPVAKAAPAEPETSWSDEPLADDWNTDSVRQANGFGGWAAGGNGSNNDVDFGDYNPPAGGGSSRPASDPTKPRKIAGQGLVKSGSAQSAPSVAAPDSGPPGELTLAE